MILSRDLGRHDIDPLKIVVTVSGFTDLRTYDVIVMVNGCDASTSCALREHVLSIRRTLRASLGSRKRVLGATHISNRVSNIHSQHDY